MSPRDSPLHTCYGDGTEIEDDVLDHIRACTWKNAMSLKMFPGDVLILDNVMCSHSRMGFERYKKDGTEDKRELIVSLGQPVTRND